MTSIHAARIVREDKWESLPLCCSYSLIALRGVPVQVDQNGASRDRTIHWAFGLLLDGQFEVLGAWPTTECCKVGWCEIFKDLEDRGVERIQFVSSDDQETVLAALCEGYPNATSLPSLQQALAPRSDLPPRLLRAFRDTDDKLAKLQRDALRAVARHGRFADSAAAAAFVVDALHRAEQRINLAQARCDTVAGKTVRRTPDSLPSQPGL